MESWQSCKTMKQTWIQKKKLNENEWVSELLIESEIILRKTS